MMNPLDGVWDGIQNNEYQYQQDNEFAGQSGTFEEGNFIFSIFHTLNI